MLSQKEIKMNRKKLHNIKVLVAHLGARKHYQEPILFQQWGILDKFYTDFYAGQGQVANMLRNPNIYNHLHQSIKKGLDRYDPALEWAKVIHFPQLGYKYISELRKGTPQQFSKINISIGQEFCRRIIKNGIGDANIVYGYDGGALELFEYAKSRGIRCVLDQTVAERSLIYRLLQQEEDTWPGWSKLPFNVNFHDRELIERQNQEQDLADSIICGSNFVKDSLVARGVAAEKIFVIPFGRCKDKIDSSFNCPIELEQLNELRILFTGSVCLRKGIPYLLEALRQLKGKIPFTCKVVGNLEISSENIMKYEDVCQFTGLLPRSQMSSVYSWANLFVFPSICEGSAMVTYEAMNWRLPTIATYNSGSIVRDEVDGYIIPIRSVDRIIEKITDIYHQKLQYQKNKISQYLSISNQESYQKLQSCLLDLIE
jgi:glycosyltransferase involved in cell wall biosynthesis